MAFFLISFFKVYQKQELKTKASDLNFNSCHFLLILSSQQPRKKIKKNKFSLLTDALTREKAIP